MGITRLGTITGLDAVGIPVAVAVRPNSRSVSVAQGKGITPAQAKASAFMEAAETFHGEDIRRRLHLRRHADWADPASCVDPFALPGNGDAFDPAALIPWVEGWDLLRGVACHVPAELVHTDFTARMAGHPRFFLGGSNGLASGNVLAEAILSGLCEVIERDAVAVWKARDIRDRARHELDPATVDDAACRALLAAYAVAGVSVRLWDVTSDLGVAAFLCDIGTKTEAQPGQRRHFRGGGCHPDRRAALARALTEAAQVRLTYIAGARDDLREEEYAPRPRAAVEDALLDALRRTATLRTFRAVPDFQSDDVAEDVAWVLGRLRAGGIARAVAVDLTRAGFGLPVVRVVVPGLEGDSTYPDYVRGPRARAAAAMRAGLSG